jgi:hypothetical protein
MMLLSGRVLDIGNEIKMSSEVYRNARLHEGQVYSRNSFVVGCVSLAISSYNTWAADSADENWWFSSTSPVLVSVKSFLQFLQAIWSLTGSSIGYALLLNMLSQYSEGSIEKANQDCGVMKEMANFDWKACIEAELEAAKAHGMERAILKIVTMEEGNDKEEGYGGAGPTTMEEVAKRWKEAEYLADLLKVV